MPRRALAVLCLAGCALAPAGGLAAPGDLIVVNRVGVDGPVVPYARFSSGPDVGLSADGRFAVFISSSDLLPGANGRNQAYRKDLATGEVVLASRAPGANGATANGITRGVGISADGRRVLFASVATNLGVTLTQDRQVWVRDVQAGTTTLVSRASGASGAPVDRQDLTNIAFADDGGTAIFSTSGRPVNLGATNGTGNLWARAIGGATTQLVNRRNGASGAPTTTQAFDPAVSGDGRRVAFRVNADDDIDPAEQPSVRDVYVRDLQAGTTTLVSRASGAAGAAADGESGNPSISADGRVVGFPSAASNLTAGAGTGAPGSPEFIFVRDLAAGTTTLASRATGADGAPAAGLRHHVLSADGHLVAFSSKATSLSAEDDDGVADVFIRDTTANTTTLVTRAAGSPGAPASGGDSFLDDMSADGRVVLFSSKATNLAPDALAPPRFTLYAREAAAPAGTGGGEQAPSAGTITLRVPRTIAAFDRFSQAGGFDIGLVDLGTGAEIPVPAGVNTAQAELHPSLSRDGRFLAFERFTVQTNFSGLAFRPAQRSVVLVNLDTGAVAVQPAPAGSGSPGLSPRAALMATGRAVQGAGATGPGGTALDAFFALAAATPAFTEGGPLASGQGAALSFDPASQVAESISPALTDLQVGGDPAAGFLAWANTVVNRDTGALVRSNVNVNSGNGFGTERVTQGGSSAQSANHPALRDDGFTAFELFGFGTDGRPRPADLRAFNPVNNVVEDAPPGINTPDADEAMPAWSHDGNTLFFVRTGPDGGRRIRGFSLNPGAFGPTATDVAIGGLPPTGDLSAMQRVYGNVSVARQLVTRTTTIGGITCDAACRGGLGAGVLSPRLGGQSSIGILVSRVLPGTRTVLGRRIARTRVVGRVPLGVRAAGRARIAWGFRVNGRRLPAGRYLLVFRRLTGDGTRVLEVSDPVTFTVPAARRR